MLDSPALSKFQDLQKCIPILTAKCNLSHRYWGLTSDLLAVVMDIFLYLSTSRRWRRKSCRCLQTHHSRRSQLYVFFWMDFSVDSSPFSKTIVKLYYKLLACGRRASVAIVARDIWALRVERQDLLIRLRFTRMCVRLGTYMLYKADALCMYTASAEELLHGNCKHQM